jgi:hypothetical protein
MQIEKHDWCDICKQKLPVWENYHAKTNAASGALRALLRAAKLLPPTTRAGLIAELEKEKP